MDMKEAVSQILSLILSASKIDTLDHCPGQLYNHKEQNHLCNYSNNSRKFKMKKPEAKDMVHEFM